MKKKLFFVAAFIAVHVAVHAQTTVAKTADAFSFNGYTIQLQKTPAGGYVYNILSRNSVVIHRELNPFTGSKNGLKKKEDAIKAAKWEAIHINTATDKPLPIAQRLPTEVARQLSISLD